MKNSFHLVLWPIVALAIYLTTQALCGLPMGIAIYLDPKADTSSWMGVTLLVSSIVTSGIILFMQPFGLRNSFCGIGCNRLSAVIAIIATMFALLASDIVNEMLDLPNMFEELFVEMSGTIWGMLAIGIFGPICEEIVFRGGIMKPMLDRGVHPWIAIAASAVVFGLVHGNPAQILFAMLVGIVFGIVYYRTGSLVITSLCHILNNSLSVVLMNVYGEESDELTFESLLGTAGMWVVMAVATASAAALLYVFWRRTSLTPNPSPRGEGRE